MRSVLVAKGTTKLDKIKNFRSGIRLVSVGGAECRGFGTTESRCSGGATPASQRPPCIWASWAWTHLEGREWADCPLVSLPHASRTSKLEKMTNEKTTYLLPRSAAYDESWVTANRMGPNVLWLAELVAERMALEPGMRVMDLGCGKESERRGWRGRSTRSTRRRTIFRMCRASSPQSWVWTPTSTLARPTFTLST